MSRLRRASRYMDLTYPDSPNIVLDPTTFRRDEPWDWSMIFGRSGEVEIEIGFGRGRFIMEYAGRHPSRNLLGIENSFSLVKVVEHRIHQAELNNIRLLNIDGQEFLEACCPAASITALHIYFPDPWPKRRHNERRLINPAFARAVEKCLIPGGHLHFITDAQPYFAAAIPVFQHYTGLKTLKITEDSGIVSEELRVQSGYEQKYRAVGKMIYLSEFERSRGNIIES